MYERFISADLSSAGNQSKKIFPLQAAKEIKLKNPTQCRKSISTQTKLSSRKIKSPFLSLAGQTAIVNQAILLAPGLCSSAPSQIQKSNDIFADLLAVTVA